MAQFGLQLSTPSLGITELLNHLNAVTAERSLSTPSLGIT